jgi:hypothetical protein
MRRFVTWTAGLAAVAAILMGGVAVYGASLSNIPPPQGCFEANQLQNCLNFVIQSINAGVTAQSMSPATNFRNLLDNGAFQVQQRGAAERTCAQNASAATTAAYGADRWTCQTNVASGAGFSSIGTGTPTPPPGFLNETKLYRKTGALTQPVCMHQEIPSADSIPLQGQSVIFSAYVQALSATANTGAGQPVTLWVYYGTGTDEGFGTQGSASAVPPAWTGITTLYNTAVTTPTTATAWQRYNTGPVAVPLTATEVGVAICYTPSASGTAGTTDGIAITGAQLEVAGAGATAPSAYEFKPITVETAKAQRYFYTLAEPTDARGVGGMGSAATTSTCQTIIPFPVVMRAAPTFTALGTALSGSTWKIAAQAGSTVLATTFYVTTTNNATTGAYGTWTVSGTPLTAGNACYPIGANGGSILSWSADF